VIFGRQNLNTKITLKNTPMVILAITHVRPGYCLKAFNFCLLTAFYSLLFKPKVSRIFTPREKMNSVITVSL